VRPKGWCPWKIPLTPTGTELVTYWLIAQCLS
jgi:hypothetical protein